MVSNVNIQWLVSSSKAQSTVQYSSVQVNEMNGLACTSVTPLVCTPCASSSSTAFSGFAPHAQTAQWQQEDSFLAKAKSGLGYHYSILLLKAAFTIRHCTALYICAATVPLVYAHWPNTPIGYPWWQVLAIAYVLLVYALLQNWLWGYQFGNSYITISKKCL